MRRILISVLLLAATASGCSESRRPFEPTGSRIQFQLQESLDPGGHELVLVGATEQIYPCSNFPILFEMTRLGSHIAISILGVDQGGVCATSLGPARCQIYLGILPAGSYDLSFTVDGQTTHAQLLVTDQAFTIVRGESQKVTFPKPMLRRIPPGTIWGLVGWFDPAQDARAQAFLDALQGIGARPQVFEPGNYGHFQVGALGTIEEPEGHGFAYARAYLFRYDGSRNALQETVSAYADPTWVSLYDDLGNSYYSWWIK